MARGVCLFGVVWGEDESLISYIGENSGTEVTDAVTLSTRSR